MPDLEDQLRTYYEATTEPIDIDSVTVDPGTVIIGPAETADKGHDLIIFNFNRSVDEGIDMNPVGSGTGKLKGMGGFMITVQAVSGKY